MAVTATPVFVQTPKLGVVNFVEAVDAAGTYKTLYAAGANGSKITGINIATTDTTVAHVVTLVVTRSAVDYIVGAVNVPVNSGSNGSAVAVDGLSLSKLPLDNDSQPYLFLQSGDTLRATFATALTTSTRIDVACVAADF
jgi:hypothetical protein